MQFLFMPVVCQTPIPAFLLFTSVLADNCTLLAPSCSVDIQLLFGRSALVKIPRGHFEAIEQVRDILKPTCHHMGHAIGMFHSAIYFQNG